MLLSDALDEQGAEGLRKPSRMFRVGLLEVNNLTLCQTRIKFTSVSILRYLNK